MSRHFLIFPVALLSFTLFAADTPTTPNESSADKDKAAQSKEPKQQDLSYRQRIVTGKIAGMKDAEVKAEGKTETHTLAKIQTPGEHVIVVDLGTHGSLKTEFKEGDEIAAFGIAGRMNQKPLLVASKVAKIVPIEGRDDIYESIPASFEENRQGNNFDGRQMNGQQPINTSGERRFTQDEQRSGANVSGERKVTNESFSREALERSNAERTGDRRLVEDRQGFQQPNVQPGRVPCDQR
ncbi:MAG TPA: hypothetical protein VKX17_13905 [Planctomycetota bacterium]|nr:hypothetical protein [Planctomycetota bacterium]